MEITEIARLYKTIKRYFPGFDASLEAVKDAHRYLKFIPFDLAQDNIDQHIMTAKFPPTIADIRGNHQEHSSTIPDANETREAFKALDEWKAKAIPMPDHIRKELSRIVRGQSDSAG